MSGTVFIKKETGYIQQCFPASEGTAFVANASAYTTLSLGYTYSYQQEGPDDESVRWALELMRTGRPRFMRVHLRNPGSAGFECMTTAKDVDWQFDIWPKDSPYRIATERADSLLRVFLDGLNTLGVLEKTVIIVVGDHGQDDAGWHPLQSPDGAITTLVLWGPGVKSGMIVPYAEHTDIVPTICALIGIKPPAMSQGRVIVEALAEFSGTVEPRIYRMKELNEQLFEYQKSQTEVSQALQQLASPKRGSLYYRLDTIRQNFYDIYRFSEWPRFTTLEELLANNRIELQQLRELLREVAETR
jgi:membrane-anchored protein YejM (alkaline phosphatase superfamily)